jgi:hypothetical protein
VKLGDLVAYEDHFWVVTRYDPKRTRTATLRRADGHALEVPHDQTLRVIANPSSEWPYVASPLKPRWGPVVKLTRPSRVNQVELVLYHDWLPSDPVRAGGSIFLNPNLRLQIGDYLLATHADGHASSVVIPGGFGTVQQRQARMTKPKPELRTSYTRLLDDDPFEDD